MHGPPDIKVDGDKVTVGGETGADEHVTITIGTFTQSMDFNTGVQSETFDTNLPPGEHLVIIQAGDYKYKRKIKISNTAGVPSTPSADIKMFSFVGNPPESTPEAQNLVAHDPPDPVIVDPTELLPAI